MLSLFFDHVHFQIDRFILLDEFETIVVIQPSDNAHHFFVRIFSLLANLQRIIVYKLLPNDLQFNLMLNWLLIL